MKKCIFRKNAYGFDEWCRCVRKITHDVTYCHTHFGSKKEYRCLYENEFNEYKIILEFKKHLTERQLFFFENYLTRHHIVPEEYKFTMEEYRQMVEAFLNTNLSLHVKIKIIEMQKKLNKIESGNLLGFLIVSGLLALAVVICFIVNLAVSKTLSWFWIVLIACLCGDVFTLH